MRLALANEMNVSHEGTIATAGPVSPTSHEITAAKDVK